MFLNKEVANPKHDDGVAIVIGKTFEATTLADGSQQVIAKTRYKRLNDGYIWTESNVIQLNEIEDIMRDTGVVEDQPVKKQAKTWSLSYSSSESVGTVDAAELDAALSSSPTTDGYPGDPAGRKMYRRSMNTRPPVLTPKFNGAGGGAGMFPPTMSFDEESSVHPGKQSYDMRAFGSPDENNNRRSDAYDGDNSIAIIDKGRSHRRRRCMGLFVSICLVIAGIVVAAFILKPWVKSSDSSANQAPENVDARDVGVDISDTASDMSESAGAGMTDGAINGEVVTGSDAEIKNSDVIDEEDEVVTPCIQLKIKTEADKESTDITPWRLTRAGKDDSTITIGAADSLSFDDSNTFDECVDPGVYTFHISDSGGDGLGERGKTGYIISADGIDFGVSTWFLHDEKMTFSLPLVEESNTGFCSDDFLLVIKTDNKPEEVYWDVVDNNNGETVLRGGPYSLPESIHTHRACLSDGNYTFHMNDLGGDGVCCDDGKGFFSLYHDEVELVDSNGQFGYKNSTIFVLASP